MSEHTSRSRLLHVVLMRFPSALDAAQDAELRRIVLSLPSEIDDLLTCRFGSDLTGSRTDGYQYLLHTEFTSTDTLASYVAHAAHQVLVRWLEDHECQRLAFDYYLDESTDAFS